MKTLQKLLLISVLMFSFSCVFSACGDDDDEPEGTSGAPYPGVWRVTYVNVTDEDGESYAGPMPDETKIKLTLYQNGNFIFESLVEDDLDAPSAVTEKGTWSYGNQVLTLNVTEPYAGRGTINVITWTDTKLVTNIPDEMDAGSGTLTWTKSAGVNI